MSIAAAEDDDEDEPSPLVSLLLEESPAASRKEAPSEAEEPSLEPRERIRQVRLELE